MSVPGWVQDAVFYQIFPDRFANGDPTNDPSNRQPWGEKPTIWGFQGGDLQGVSQRLDYLVDLGINAIYLNPIFQATSNHRYNTSDYYRIDPGLGSMADFKTLVHEAHQRGLRILLDGVFNHCGRGFFAFNDVMENQEHSPYCDWFHIKQFPLEAYQPGDAENYLGWWKYKSLPKFNTDNPRVRRFIFDVARYWIDQGIDGWRLDVPNEIDDDGFWAEFRQVVKQANPEAYLLGEIWDIAPRWVGPDHFDGLMNYPLRDALIQLISTGSKSAQDFKDFLGSLLGAYPRENTYAHYLALGSHDTPRLATLLKGDRRKLELLYLILFSYPGAPAIYYGDEIGLEGRKDPDSRRAFTWDESTWDHDLRNYIRQLIQLRRETAELRSGEVRLLSCEAAGVVALARQGLHSTSLIVFNATEESLDVRLPVVALDWPEGQVVDELIHHTRLLVSDGKLGLHLTPFQGLLLR
ncbi:MAG: alpha-amylase family glycosyl hydrolase, partial [Anaerolineales bacterium]|nr:alpha-amylase family glycosyl hydrolase [Anaerolineales bacterium]